MKKVFFLLLWINFLSFGQSGPVRTIITTDGEIDDVDTFIRLLLYSNEFKLEGLIYSSSMWHYKGDGRGTKFTSKMKMTQDLYGEQTQLRWPGVEWMNPLLNAYEQVYPNLINHSKNYPKPSYLKSIVRVGNIDFEGEMEKITEGSEWIKQKLLDSDNSPIYLQAWGGTNTIARALKSIEEDFKNSKDWEKVKTKINQKAIIYTIMDQDDTYQTYISKAWPEIMVYYNSQQFGSFAYFWKKSVPEPLHPYFQGSFMKNIILNNGPLLKQYYAWGDGQKQEGDPEHFEGDPSKMKHTMFGSFDQWDFISEGDTPAFLHLVNTGLGNTSNPHFGGWGGRFLPSKENPKKFIDAKDLNPTTGKMDSNYPQARWIKDMQNDFAARASWCVRDFKDANHAPKISLPNGNHFPIKKGETIQLVVKTEDPDNDLVKIRIFAYAEPGNGSAQIFQNNSNTISLSLPENAVSGDEYHVIIEGEDNRTPQLKGYQRVILKAL